MSELKDVPEVALIARINGQPYDKVILAENTPFVVEVTRYTGPNWEFEKAIIQEILDLKERVRKLEEK
jgi:hypothetical protein